MSDIKKISINIIQNRSMNMVTLKKKPEQCDSRRNGFLFVFLYNGVINSRQSEDFDNHGLKIINEK